MSRIMKIMKRILAMTAALMLSALCFAGNHYGSVGIGYYNTLSIGAGYNFSDRMSVGIEVDGWSEFCGLIGGVDARYRFSDWNVKPFVDVMAGYGLLGVTYENKNYYNYACRAMTGISWKGFELGAGVAYDTYNKAWPVAMLTYSFSFAKGVVSGK